MRFRFEMHAPALAGYTPDRTASASIEAEALPVVLEAFEDFLRGCGFNPAGHLDFVDDGDEAEEGA
jgi:hypothetical protein